MSLEGDAIVANSHGSVSDVDAVAVCGVNAIGIPRVRWRGHHHVLNAETRDVSRVDVERAAVLEGEHSDRQVMAPKRNQLHRPRHVTTIPSQFAIPVDDAAAAELEMRSAYETQQRAARATAAG